MSKDLHTRVIYYLAGVMSLTDECAKGLVPFISLKGPEPASFLVLFAC